ncbi:MAG: SRPBCC family protein [Myxococcales bacterium]
MLRRLLLTSLFLLASPALAEEKPATLPAEGKPELTLEKVPDSEEPRYVVRGVFSLPAKKVWKIVSDCAAYKDHMPRVVASKLVSREDGDGPGKSVHVCEVKIGVPFPLSDLTGVTRAVHTETDRQMSRVWKLEKGDYEFNEGSWEVTALEENKALAVYKLHAKPKANVPAWMRKSAQQKAMVELFERVGKEAAKLP